MIRLQNIQKVFNAGTINEAPLFSDFSFAVEKGAFVSVVGSNGSGKTTMLNIISGSLPVDSGTILLDGEDITSLPEHRRARRIGRVFQDPAIGTVPNMTILENLSLAENKGNPYTFGFAVKRQKREEFCELVRRLGLGLEDKMDIPVGLLSGGQRQALSLLMSTMTPMDLLLLDEHTAALDPKTAEVIMELTDAIIKEKQITALMVTHNLRYAVEYGSRLVMMDKGQIVLDKDGSEKQNTSIDDILHIFNQISIECGN
ncbi:MAG: ATP-binding cassette domain-containing protein [Clostridia bacterium]|nr:ATP-binding cassette domain-containing protein [Clostridia bacterium]